MVNLDNDFQTLLLSPSHVKSSEAANEALSAREKAEKQRRSAFHRHRQSEMCRIVKWLNNDSSSVINNNDDHSNIIQRILDESDALLSVATSSPTPGVLGCSSSIMVTNSLEGLIQSVITKGHEVEQQQQENYNTAQSQRCRTSDDSIDQTISDPTPTGPSQPFCFSGAASSRPSSLFTGSGAATRILSQTQMKLLLSSSIAQFKSGSDSIGESLSLLVDMCCRLRPLECYAFKNDDDASVNVAATVDAVFDGFYSYLHQGLNNNIIINNNNNNSNIHL
eukprot:GHVR01020227.1.p1 GENE.GHVR01020227.1~~GHVR01020227.1.p1  ORF type:complete len:279 (+),score=64.58 GHVR01020227.1:25-861(+)